MPNWCYNHIEISGDDDNFNKFKEKFESLKESTHIMTDLIGLGDNVPDDYYDQGWYGHNIDRFGTKWDFGYKDASIHIGKYTVDIVVDTAWSPPVNFISELCKQYKVVAVATFEEPGMDFAGKAVFENDGNFDMEECTINEWHYQNSREYFWDNVENEVEYVIEDIENVDDYVEKYPYVEVDDIPRLKQLFEKYKK